jgi:hypothetical protein
VDVTVLLYWEFSFCELAGASNLIAAPVPYFIIGSSDVLFIRSNVVFRATIVALSLLSALCAPEAFGTQLSISYTDRILILKARNMSARPTITVTLVVVLSSFAVAFLPLSFSPRLGSQLFSTIDKIPLVEKPIATSKFNLTTALCGAGLAFDAYAEPAPNSTRWERGVRTVVLYNKVTMMIMISYNILCFCLYSHKE